MSYALDTNTLVYFFRGTGGIANRMLAIPPSQVAIPAVVVFELETGIRKSNAPTRRRAQLRSVLEHITVLPFGVEEARASAEVRASLEAAGRPIGPLDTLIAGTALATGRVLITRNLREFERVPGLRLENWYAE